MVRLQPLTRARVASLGGRGSTWVEELPGLLSGLSTEWGLELGSAVPGGSNSYVVRVLIADGSDAVLKLVLDDAGLADQIRVLEAADGRGYARLSRHDLTRGALLLEALGDPLQTTARPVAEQLSVLADTLATAWQVAAAGPWPPTADKARGLAGLVTDHWAQLGRPCSVAVRDQALRYAEALADPPEESLVVVHGDPHPGNALAVRQRRAGAETGYCFVDPDGFVADRAYDLGVTMRDYSARVLDRGRPVAESYCALLAERSGVDPIRIWRWAFLERVCTGLYVLGFGSEPVARPFLTSAELLLD
ncbi:MAG: aminoglycoside phosphotransferase family protein [Microlunatus sp.]|nr:aminoglycoside phosphotransferase family protein [Microlunatus sp.]MDN5770052.1 aminoglycoside phosphotransferase family protein [Microlunatus sp.]